MSNVPSVQAVIHHLCSNEENDQRIQPVINYELFKASERESVMNQTAVKEQICKC
jgi:hypothetical protein